MLVDGGFVGADGLIAVVAVQQIEQIPSLVTKLGKIPVTAKVVEIVIVVIFVLEYSLGLSERLDSFDRSLVTRLLSNDIHLLFWFCKCGLLLLWLCCCSCATSRRTGLSFGLPCRLLLDLLRRRRLCNHGINAII